MERFGWLRRYVSPVFLALLVASFILWYIAKLNYTYTTEQPFTVNVDGERFKVSCVVEGVARSRNVISWIRRCRARYWGRLRLSLRVTRKRWEICLKHW